ncbi:MAG TPA: hypothetical protein VGP89_09415 [Candidatus Angelobacter sp.]|jgi:hypothetical protein|nr:hypothetical protein [Candidatus Angelobacter sp.]
MFTLVFESKGKKSTKDFPSLDLCLRAANRMMVNRTGSPMEIRKEGKLLMAIGSLHDKLRELDAR